MSKPGKCHWKYADDEDSWETQCGQKFQFTIGGPHENGFRYCYHCGLKLRAPSSKADKHEAASLEPEA